MVLPIDYAALQATATSMIETMGRPAVLRPIEGGADIAVTALMSNSGAAERDGALISFDDRRAIVAAKPGVPFPDPEKYRLVLDAVSYRIVTTRTAQPDLTTLYFVCQVRR